MSALVIVTELLYCAVSGQKDMGGRRARTSRVGPREIYFLFFLFIRTIHTFFLSLSRFIVKTIFILVVKIFFHFYVNPVTPFPLFSIVSYSSIVRTFLRQRDIEAPLSVRVLSSFNRVLMTFVQHTSPLPI